ARPCFAVEVGARSGRRICEMDSINKNSCSSAAEVVGEARDVGTWPDNGKIIQAGGGGAAIDLDCDWTSAQRGTGRNFRLNDRAVRSCDLCSRIPNSVELHDQSCSRIEAAARNRDQIPARPEWG